MTQSELSTSKGPEAVRIWLLGGFSVSVDSKTLRQEEGRPKKAATLVKLLALAPGHRMHREQAIDLLWPDSGKKAASNNLRQVLYGARRALDPASGTSERHLRLRDEQLVLWCPEGHRHRAHRGDPPPARRGGQALRHRRSTRSYLRASATRPPQRFLGGDHACRSEKGRSSSG
jgi:hypothetical protein